MAVGPTSVPGWGSPPGAGIPRARPAATVVVARPGSPVGAADEADGTSVEVLVLRRSADSRFAPGFLVFPGGVIDERDADLALRWFGTEAELARACALRELAEETGLVMTAHGPLSRPGSIPGQAGLPPPSLEDVPEMARWVAPEFLPVRFDARFFAVAAPRGLVVLPNRAEADRAWWMSPQEALRRQREGSVSLMWPTLKTMEALARCRSVAAVLALRVDPVAPPHPTSAAGT